jgi:uncharacterized membrane protein YdfJ with MMPL/SSD domain
MRLSTHALALASARHPWRTIGVWLAAILLAFAGMATLLPGALTTEGKPTNNPQSQQALDVRAAAFAPDPKTASSDIVLVRSQSYEVDAQPFRAFVGRLSSDLGALQAVTTVRSYLDGGDPSLVSADRKATMLPILVDDSYDVGQVIDTVRQADAEGAFTVSVTGNTTLDYDFNKLSQEDLQKGELQFGLPAALIILLIVFGSVVAGLVPVFTAIISILVSLGLVSVLAQQFELSIFIVNMLTAMGLALGIDYSLFVISRYREERGRGLEQLDAIAACGATASRAVLFSGSAFVVAMFGMLIVPSSIMRSLATGAIVVGIVSVLAGLTLLPAVLGLLGDRINALRLPLVGRSAVRGADPEGRFWREVVERVLGRPAIFLALSATLLILAALPVLGMHVGGLGVSTLPDRFDSKQGFLALERDFPQATTDPVQVVVAQLASTAPVRRALDGLRLQLARDPRFGSASVRTSADGEVAVLSAPVRGDSSSDEAVAAVRELRDDTVPSFFGGTGATVLVGGDTSEAIDYFASVTDPAPIVFTVVLGLTLVLLTIAFRSIVVAATAVVLNLLSVGAAYGLLVLVFQRGVGAGLLGVQQADVIEAWVPLFLFSVLFGLSMDYQVFLLSRIKERYDQTGDTTAAISFGVASTARIITGAALIIIAVFSGFARGDLVMFQQMGFGVAVALLLDATVVRSILLPSAMSLLGRWNWYLPRWLEWLPRLEIEAHAG